MNRRSFLAGAAACAVRNVIAQSGAIPIIDTHIHLYDTKRSLGAPYPTVQKGPSKTGALPQRPISLPSTYRTVAPQLGIVGAIVVEASPWVEDNLWVLERCEQDTLMVGMIGDLEPDRPDFGQFLERYQRSPLFRGIRYGNLWGRNLAAMLSKNEFISGLKLLAQAGLVLDTANPNPDLIETVLRLSDKVSNLRVVVDHLPELDPPSDRGQLSAYEGNLRELAKRPQVYIKVSGVIRRVNGRVPTDPNFYKPRLDQIFDTFGEDRLIFGSDWPNSDQWGTIETVVSLVRPYFMNKGRAVAEKYFWKNSVAAYHWIKRESAQPQLA
jgi:L-fuconolactonase